MKDLFVPWFCEKGVSLHHPLGFNLAPKLEGAGKNMFINIYIYKHIYILPPKTNMEPKNGGLEYAFPFRTCDFQLPR